MGDEAWTLAVHGGAGTIAADQMTPEAEAGYRAGLETALRAGQEVLASGGAALDAVVAAVEAFEDDPLFNAGKGAVFTQDGRIELDASVMDGKTGAAGAVAGVSTVKHPVAAARCVMERSPHVLLIGAGADRFAADHGLDRVEPSYFFTQARWDQLQEARAAARVRLDHDAPPRDPFALPQAPPKLGTVGAVARDRNGNLAAATSTGGMTNKLPGRVGDSPVIGAGCYAHNDTVAVSCTGTGESFMRGVVAYDIAARMKYLKQPLAEAVADAIRASLDATGGRGGLIAVDRAGAVALEFNTAGMYRGWVRAGEAPVVRIYRE